MGGIVQMAEYGDYIPRLSSDLTSGSWLYNLIFSHFDGTSRLSEICHDNFGESVITWRSHLAMATGLCNF